MKPPTLYILSYRDAGSKQWWRAHELYWNRQSAEDEGQWQTKSMVSGRHELEYQIEEYQKVGVR